VIDLALPPICAGCDKDIENPDDHLPLCLACRHSFATPVGPICSRCAAPAPAASIREAGCMRCEQTPFHFQRLAALGVYQGELRSIVLRMKHVSGESLAIATGKLLARRIRELDWPSPELVTGVPMHWTRRLWRSVNAAGVLAEAVADELRLPVALDLVRARRNAPRQSRLTPARRRHNMRGVFRASAAYDIRDTHVLVTDDVLTTGATANAMAKALRQAGAASVSVGVIARGIGAT